MAYGTRATFEPLREIAFGGIGANYVVFGGPTIDYCRLITISNGMDEDLYISFDGVNNHIRIVANSFDKGDITTNRVNGAPIFLPRHTQIYVKRVLAAPTVGDAWISIMYAAGGK